MANLNRDYGKGTEFFLWTLAYILLLTLLMVWVYDMNFKYIP